MADIRCPMCSKPNPADQEVCQYCGARLKPLIPGANNSQTIRPGDQPVSKGTGELDRAKLGDMGPIRPGEAPTNKKTADLEKALPSWLRSLREDQGESLPPEDDQPPFNPAPETPATGGTGDWLSGLNNASASEEEAVPDWLSGLRGDKPAEPPSGPGFEPESGSELGNADWMSRLDGAPSSPAEPEPATPFAADTPAAPAEETPSWLKSFQSYDSTPAGSVPPPASPSRPYSPRRQRPEPSSSPRPAARTPGPAGPRKTGSQSR